MYIGIDCSLTGSSFKRDTSSIDFLSELVAMDSQVSNLAGIEDVQKKLYHRIKDLGFDVEFIQNPEIQSAPLLYATRKGITGKKVVSFIGHADVVTSPKMNPFRIDGGRVYGSGVADDKGGVVTCLASIERFLKKVPEHNFDINIIISPNEETGSIGFHKFFKEIGAASTYVLGLEPALDSGNIISSRSGNRWYHIQSNGIAAHAGRFGNNYINAAHALSLSISKFHSLNNDKQMQRLNVGSLGGGNGGFNTICDSAWAKLDMRFTTFECRDKLHEKVEQILEQTIVTCPYSGAKNSFFYSLEDDCPPMSSGHHKENWFQGYIDYISKVENRTIKGVHAGGAADVNYFSHKENFTLDGLGPVGANLHTRKEYIEKDSLETRIQALEFFMMELNLSEFFIKRAWRLDENRAPL